MNFVSTGTPVLPSSSSSISTSALPSSHVSIWRPSSFCWIRTEVRTVTELISLKIVAVAVLIPAEEYVWVKIFGVPSTNSMAELVQMPIQLLLRQLLFSEMMATDENDQK